MTPSTRCLLSLFSAVAFALPVQATPALWTVSDGDSHIWMFGSVHMLPDGFVWRTDLFDTILTEADQIVFETDIRPQAQALLAAEILARGIYTDGTLLTDVIDPETESLLRFYTASYNIPVGSLLAMRPWLAASTINVAVLASKGYNVEGVDFQIVSNLPDDRLLFLESGTEQIDVLSGAEEAEQIAMLKVTLEDLHKMPRLIDKTISNWSDGEPEMLEALLKMEMRGYDEAFLERFLYQRNKNWLLPLEKMLTENQNNLVIVGAAHLAGVDSVLDLLEQAGYTVTRIQ